MTAYHGIGYAAFPIKLWVFNISVDISWRNNDWEVDVSSHGRGAVSEIEAS